MARGLNGGDTSATAVTRRMRLLVLAGLLCAWQFYLNWPVLEHDWVYFDDDINIVLNPHLTGGSAETWHWAWTNSSYNRRYMPLGWLMFDGLFRVGGLSAAVYHAASWLLAAGNTVLLFFIVRRFGQHRQIADTPNSWRDTVAALAVLLLSVHPLRAETTGWASGLLYLASTFLASFAVWMSFPLRAGQVRPASEWLGRLFFLSSLLLYPVYLALPVLLIIAALCSPSVATGTASWTAVRLATRRYGSWLLFSLAVGGWNIFAAATSSTFSSPGGMTGYSLGTRIAHAAAMLAHYMAQMLWPAITSPFYGDWGVQSVGPRLILPFGVLGVAGLLVAWRRTRRATGVACAALLVTVLPFVGLFDQGQGASDRYTFLLLAVTAILVAVGLEKIPGHGAKLVATLGLLALTFFLLPAYRSALAVWRTTATLQARVDFVTAARPDVRLGFARPAIHSFLSGDYVASRQRLVRGFTLFGSHPDLLGAATFIEETRTLLMGDWRDPSTPPYAVMHLDLAKKHAAAGNIYAAKVHTDFAHRLKVAPGPQP